MKSSNLNLIVFFLFVTYIIISLFIIAYYRTKIHIKNQGDSFAKIAYTTFSTGIISISMLPYFERARDGHSSEEEFAIKKFNKGITWFWVILLLFILVLVFIN